jgi:hypothetical protein
MSDASTAAIVQTILDWVKAPWKMFTILFLISALALFAPKSWLEATNMNTWVQGHWALLVLICAFSGLFLLITVIEERAKPVLARNKHKRETEEKYNKIERTLKSLQTDEIGPLGYFGGGHSTQGFNSFDAVPKSLANKGILKLIQQTGIEASYSLTQDVIAFLAARDYDTIAIAIQRLQQQK